MRLSWKELDEVSAYIRYDLGMSALNLFKYSPVYKPISLAESFKITEIEAPLGGLVKIETILLNENNINVALCE